MSATKKQVNDLENAVVILEERLEKMEEEHQLLKQMISMQSTLIDNLQMMVKMMSVSSPTSYKVMHVGGDAKTEDLKAEETKADVEKSKGENEIQVLAHSIKTLKTRMSRVV